MRQYQIGLELSRIIFIGRTFDEYVRMFDLTETELKQCTMLDAPAGACSFTSIASQAGYRVTAADIAYYHSPGQLYEKGKEDIKHAMEGISKVQDAFQWEYFRSIDQLEQHRNSALQDCIHHMKTSPKQYVPVILPELPFEDDQFDITLSAHFLFMYAERLDLDFHKKTLQEMIRVSRKEVRIFPVTDLKGMKYEYLPEILRFVEELGWNAEERNVSYEFQRKANSMLRLYRKRGEPL
jgi:hypothetical protein